MLGKCWKCDYANEPDEATCVICGADLDWAEEARAGGHEYQVSPPAPDPERAA